MAEGNAVKIECCGSERATPFCPECGKRIRNIHSIYGLLEHCQLRLQILKSGLNRSKLANPDLPQGSRGSIKRTDKQMSINKWENWVDELTKLLQRN